MPVRALPIVCVLGLCLLVTVPAATAQTVIFVDADAAGSGGAGDGSSWADAFPHLRDALAAAAPGDALWVAEGTYRPTDGGPDPDDRTATFTLPDGVAVFGGFDGTETALGERDWAAHPAVLSGEIGHPDDRFDNSYHVVTASGVGPATTLDGLTVERGGWNLEEDEGGGGVLAVGGSPTLRRVVFRVNGGELGGGLHVEDGSPLVEDVLFEENRGRGGGARFSGGAPVLRRVTFRDNFGLGGGAAFVGGAEGLVEDALFEGNDGLTLSGGVYVEDASPRFVRCTFRGNGDPEVTLDGGGAYITGPEAAPVFEDCLFEDNEVNSTGAGAYVSNAAAILYLNGPPRGEALFANVVFVGNEAAGAGSTAGRGGSVAVGVGVPVRFVGATFAGNRAEQAGGGVFAFSEAVPLRIENSVVWGNEAPAGPAVFVEDPDDGGADGPTATRAIVEGGCPAHLTCEGVTGEDPLFVRDPDPGPDGAWGTADDDYGDLRLSEGSPGVDAGLAALLPPDRWDLDGDGDTEEPLPLDLMGGPRVVGPAVDLGAYEGAVPVSAEAAPTSGDGLTLAAYPNPSRGAVTLALDLPLASPVRVAVVDVLGREVAVLHDNWLAAGSHSFGLDAARLPAGVYLVRATGTAAEASTRVTVVR